MDSLNGDVSQVAPRLPTPILGKGQDGSPRMQLSVAATQWMFVG